MFLLSCRNFLCNWILDCFLQSIFRSSSTSQKTALPAWGQFPISPSMPGNHRLSVLGKPLPHEILSPKYCAIEIPLSLLEALGLASSMSPTALEFSKCPLEKTSRVFGVSLVSSVPYDQEPCVFPSSRVPLHSPNPNLSSSKCPQRRKWPDYQCTSERLLPLTSQFSSSLLLPVSGVLNCLFWCFKSFFLVVAAGVLCCCGLLYTTH